MRAVPCLGNRSRGETDLLVLNLWVTPRARKVFAPEAW